MKIKLLNCLNVCLATVGLLSIGTPAIATNVENQSNSLEAQNWVNELSSNNNANSKQCTQPQLLLPQKLPQSNIQPSQENQLGQINQILITIVIGATVMGYMFSRSRAKKNRYPQTASLQEQIEMLERIWNKSPHC